MLLYDIFYRDRTMDTNVSKLPLANESIRYAFVTNGEREYFVPRGGTWVRVPVDEAVGR